MTKPALSEISLIVFDFDGVMTDNRVYVFEDGREAVVCNRSDGLGIDMLRDAGVPMCIISTETNSVVGYRAQKLKLECIQGCGDKESSLVDLAKERKIDLSTVVYVGNDINDLAAMKRVGWPMAPADAHHEVKAIAKHVIGINGGDGVVRALADHLLQH